MNNSNKIYAQAILVDNKIIDWKIGYSKWKSFFHAKSSGKLFTMGLSNKAKLVETSFIENEINTNKKIFEELAIEWLKQYEIHKDILGMSPY